MSCGVLSVYMHIQNLYVCLFLQDLSSVDHDKIYYAPFRKSFYVEVPEISRMTSEGEIWMFKKKSPMITAKLFELIFNFV